MERVPEALDPLVFAFAGLGGLLATRGTSRAARRRAGPLRATLWAALRPTGAHGILHAASPACAALLVAAFGLPAAGAGAIGVRALGQACARGRLATARWFADYFMIVPEPGPINTITIFDALTKACLNGHTAVVRWLVARYLIFDTPVRIALGTYIDDSRARLALMASWTSNPRAKIAEHSCLTACQTSRLTTVRWLANQFTNCIGATRASRDAYQVACRHNYPALMQWLSDHFVHKPEYALASGCSYGRLSTVRRFATVSAIDDETFNCYLFTACAGGHGTVSRWLAHKAQVDSAGALRWACSRGHRAVARWLVARFGLTWRHVLVNGDDAVFGAACQAGVPTARWLADRFALGAPLRVPKSVPRALLDACTADNLAVARWIADRFIRTATFPRRFSGGDLLETVCGIGDNASVPIMRWLVARFSFGGARHNYYGTLYDICVRGRPAAARWYASRFSLARAGSDYRLTDALIGACDHGHFAIAEWLIVHFGLTAENARDVAHAAARRLGDRAPCVTQWLAQYFALNSIAPEIEAALDNTS